MMTAKLPAAVALLLQFSGWVYLFNGKSMDQRHTYGKPGLDPGWTIQQDSVL